MIHDLTMRESRRQRTVPEVNSQDFVPASLHATKNSEAHFDSPQGASIRLLKGVFIGKFALVLVLVIGGLFSAQAEDNPAGRKKFIQVGWDSPGTGYMKAHWREMEKAPFDGVIYRVEVSPVTNKTVSSLLIWNREPWKRDWFTNALNELKSCRFTRFTDNFLQIDATPGDLDWADDAGWEALADKIALCGWIARESGSKGLCLDFESYAAKQFQWSSGEKSFAQTADMARRRGALVMRRLAREYPDATLLAFWLNSVNSKSGQMAEPNTVLAGEAYGLLPAFINGLLDVMPSTMRLVDGCENGYYMDSAEEYLRAASDIRSWNGAAARLVSAENRGRYRMQVQAGFGFYLDMFINEEGRKYYFPPLDGSRLARLDRNLTWARDASDEYVWIYGEQCRWWALETAWASNAVENTVGKGQPWETALPGITRTIARVRDLKAAALEELAERKNDASLTNLLFNGDFALKDEKEPLPAYWDTWQDTDSKGTLSWDKTMGSGSAKATGVSNGVFLQRLRVNPGETYVVQGDCQKQGNLVSLLAIRWQNEEGQWTALPDDQAFGFLNTTNGWGRALGVVVAPHGARFLVFMAGIRQQQAANDACWFDNMKAFRLLPTR